MKGEDYLNYLASLRGKEVDRRYLHELIDRLNLDPGRKNKEYSHGNRQKMGIVVAVMGKPEVLILDRGPGPAGSKICNGSRESCDG